MDFSLTPEQDAFREQVRAWLKENIPRDWSRRVMASAEVPRPEAYQFLRDWQRTLYDAGFVGLTWPKEYGGRGLTFMEELILHEEMALAKAPQILNILGVGMAGPTIIAYGTEEQKKRYPAKILSCEEIWCQGYSEPDGGPDAARRRHRTPAAGVAPRDPRRFGAVVPAVQRAGRGQRSRVAPDSCGERRRVLGD